MRGVALLIVWLVNVGSAQAALPQCRAAAAKRVASLYGTTAKAFGKCSARYLSGQGCDELSRDASLQTVAARTRQKIITACTPADATALGFATNADLAIRTTGIALGEGRQAADAVFGRPVQAAFVTARRCADAITKGTAKAGQTQIKTLLPCGSTCLATQVAAVDQVWSRTATSLGLRCTAADLTLLGINLTSHLTARRLDAQRAVQSLQPGALPVPLVVTPTATTVLAPPAFPTTVPMVVRVGNVPHLGYVNGVRAAGTTFALDTSTATFSGVVDVIVPRSSVPIALQARTTFGNQNGSTTLRFDLGTLEPAVVIQTPVSGAILGTATATIQGQVLGNRALADDFRLNGVTVPFDAANGAFSVDLPIGPQALNLVTATVHSSVLGTTNTDTIVIFRGTAWPITASIPNANHNRLNRSGFTALQQVLQTQMATLLDRSHFVGQSMGGAEVTDFSVGATAAVVQPAAPQDLQVDLNVPSLRIDLKKKILGANCSIRITGSRVRLHADVDLRPRAGGGMDTDFSTLYATIDDFNFSVSGPLVCGAIYIFAGDPESSIAIQFAAGFGDAFTQAVTGIDLASQAGGPLGVTITSQYDDILEEATGVSFLVDSNIDLPPGTLPVVTVNDTLLPIAGATPPMPATVPGTSTPYDLGFCFSDGFVNRLMATFMRGGRFNSQVDAIAGVPLTTTLLSAILADPAYQAACPNCPVSLVLAPTAGPVARAPLPTETATVVVTVPNYRVDVIANPNTTPQTLMTAAVTFDLPITLGITGNAVNPTTGTVVVLDTRLLSNPIAADEAHFAAGVAQVFPLAAQQIGGVFGAITLPTFQGLTLIGVDARYNQSCTGLFLNLQ